MKKYFKYISILMISILTTIVPIKVNADSIVLNKSKITLGIGYSEILDYTIMGEINPSEILWSSSNEKVATVVNGKVIAISEGTSTITASINGIKSTCKVTVNSNYITPTNIKMNKSSTTLLVGSAENLSATITPSNVTNKNITWISSNPSVVTVNSSGTISAKSVGTATITASISGFKTSCIVTVTHSSTLKGISLNKTSLTIKEKAVEQLSVIYTPSTATNKKVTWKSSDTTIATVDSSGKVTGVSPGTATITAVSNDGGYVATSKVVVEEITKKVTEVSLNKQELNLKVGETFELKATIKPDYAENKKVTWTSSDKKIATVEDGKVTAKFPGIVEIKVTTKDGNKEAICKVTVLSPPIEEFTFKESEKKIYINSEIELELTTKPENAVLENGIWTSSNEEVATVENGKVIAKSIGETTITVSNQDNTKSSSIKIIVVNKPKEKLNITVQGYNLKFNPNTKNYSLKIGNESELIINTNVDENDVVINGNQNLKDGSIITITVNDKEKITYIITIKKKQNYTIYFIAAISVLLLLNLIRLFIVKKKKPKF